MSVNLEYKAELECLKQNRIVFVLRGTRFPEAIENGDVLLESQTPPIKVRVSFARNVDSIFDIVPFLHLSGFSDCFSWVESFVHKKDGNRLSESFLYCLNRV